MSFNAKSNDEVKSIYDSIRSMVGHDRFVLLVHEESPDPRRGSIAFLTKLTDESCAFVLRKAADEQVVTEREIASTPAN